MSRGEWRPIYAAMFDGVDYRALTPPAKLVLLTVKGTLPAWGIAVVPALSHVLSERTGLPVADVGAALAELGSTGWIEREGDVLWLVRGLQFEPTMRPSHVNHRRAVSKAVEQLPRLSIVSRFLAQYPEWVEVSQAPAKPCASPAKGLTKPCEGLEGKGKGKGSRKGVRGKPSAATLAAPRPDTWLTPYLAAWEARGTVGAGQLAKAIKPFHDRDGPDVVTRALRAYLDAGKASFGPQVFARDYANWKAKGMTLDPPAVLYGPDNHLTPEAVAYLAALEDRAA